MSRFKIFFKDFGDFPTDSGQGRACPRDWHGGRDGV